jgi:hypothetical protein
MEHTAWQQVQHMLLVIDNYRMAGVVTALKTDNLVGLLRQYINNFPFSLVTPLGSDNYKCRHSVSLSYRQTGVNIYLKAESALQVNP